MVTKAKTKKVLSIITLVVLLLLILTSPIAFYILFTEKTSAINIAALATIGLLLGLTLILFILMRNSNRQTNVQNKTIKYFISMFMLLVFLSLFISSYGLYGLWVAIFKFLPPACIIGLVFIFALMLIFFMKNIGYTIVFGVPILTYPFAYINSAVNYLALGSILSGFVIGNIMVQYINLPLKVKSINKQVSKKLFFSSLKVFLLSLIVTLGLYFTLANDFKAFFADTLNLKFKDILLNLIPLAIVLLLLIFHLDYIYVFLIGIIAQTITGFILNLFIHGSAYNALNFLCFNLPLPSLQSKRCYLIAWCQSLFWFFMIVILAGFKSLYAEFITNLEITKNINHHFCAYRKTMTLSAKTDFYKKAILNLFLDNNILEEDLILMLKKSGKNQLPQHMIVYSMLSSIYFPILLVFLPFNITNFWSLLWTAHSFSFSIISGYIVLFKSFWGGYFLILFVNLFIIFNKLQIIYFKNWIPKVKIEFSLNNPSSRW